MNNSEKFNFRRKLSGYPITSKNTNEIEFEESVYEREKKYYLFNDDQDFINNIISELSKPFFNYKLDQNGNIKRNAIRRISRTKCSDDNNDLRNVNIVHDCLLRIGGFMEFCKFNGITDEFIRICTPYLSLKTFQKDDYIFKVNDKSEYFYCVLKGKVSIRLPNFLNKRRENEKNSSHIIQQNLNEEIENLELNNIHKISLFVSEQFLDDNINDKNNNKSEIEKFLLYHGGCFGEWGLIYNEKRSASAVAQEETILMYLNKQTFNDCFANPIMKSENERRKFLRNIIPIFGFSHTSSIYYKRLLVECPKRNQYIFTENSPGEEIILIYHGEFLMEKKCLKKNVNKLNGKINSENILKILTRGSFAGLEIITNMTKNYQSSLKALNNFSVIFRINPNNFPEFKEELIKHLKSAKDKLKISTEIIESISKSKNIEENKFSPVKLKKKIIEKPKMLNDYAMDSLINLNILIPPDKIQDENPQKLSYRTEEKINPSKINEENSKCDQFKIDDKTNIVSNLNQNVTKKSPGEKNLYMDLKSSENRSDVSENIINTNKNYYKNNTMKGFSSQKINNNLRFSIMASNNFPTLKNFYNINEKQLLKNIEEDMEKTIGKLTNYNFNFETIVNNKENLFDENGKKSDNLLISEKELPKRLTMNINPERLINLEKLIKQYQLNETKKKEKNLRTLTKSELKVYNDIFDWKKYNNKTFRLNCLTLEEKDQIIKNIPITDSVFKRKSMMNKIYENDLQNILIKDEKKNITFSSSEKLNIKNERDQKKDELINSEKSPKIITRNFIITNNFNYNIYNDVNLKKHIYFDYFKLNN